MTGPGDYPFLGVDGTDADSEEYSVGQEAMLEAEDAARYQEWLGEGGDAAGEWMDQHPEYWGDE